MPGDQGLSWALDLFAHWQPWYAATWLACSLLLASTRRRWLLALPLLALPWFTASRPAAQSAEPAQLTIVIANVNIRQHDPQALLQWLREHPANIVVLTELSPAYAQRLAEAGNGGFGHALLHPLDSPPGLGILSDRPLMEPRLHADTLGALYLQACIDLLGQPLRLFAVHPKPPMAVRKFKARDSLLRELAGASDQATVIAGDLNARVVQCLVCSPATQCATRHRRYPNLPQRRCRRDRYRHRPCTGIATTGGQLPSTRAQHRLGPPTGKGRHPLASGPGQRWQPSALSSVGGIA
ncbi:endonuclease/exonuclease/phosphatase family protein [Stenotrophomonas sp.]|uniref:endonuclease/exonuclease/phosphatase family protein n=1 Tax=Stenotrophomonas sp. TaxID=69392 RepID=UPI0028A7E494|nr:endonuclease/exonuclease/phosphatase family protein [Stenotrophomonas sp.]